MNPFKGLFKHVRTHHRPQEMPSWVRKRLYDNLLFLVEEENRTWNMLQIPVKPRLCIVDEERVVMIRPSDRQRLNLDEQMQRAREDKQNQNQVEPEQG